MSLYGLLRSKHGEGQTQITEKEIEAAFDGNLCRCTGYRPILDAAKTVSEFFELVGEGKGRMRERNSILVFIYLFFVIVRILPAGRPQPR